MGFSVIIRAQQLVERIFKQAREMANKRAAKQANKITTFALWITKISSITRARRSARSGHLQISV